MLITFFSTQNSFITFASNVTLLYLRAGIDIPSQQTTHIKTKKEYKNAGDTRMIASPFKI
jgi:hypothetical protein